MRLPVQTILKRNNVAVAALAAVVVAAHVATSFRYGYYRDELYFIACAKRLAWGFVDQPPLLPLIAWTAAPEHYAPIVLRLPAALAAGATVYVAWATVLELGGGSAAALLAASCAALLPAGLFLGNTLTTTSFEPLTWALAVYLTLRLTRSGSAGLWTALAAVATFGLYAKYSMLLLLGALLAGLLATPQRQVLRTRAFPIAAASVALAVLPNVLWQASHGWPFLAVLHGDVVGRRAFNSGLTFEYASTIQNAPLFLAEQALFTNPFFMPLWIAGLLALFRVRSLARGKFLGCAYVILLVAALASNAKGYYIAGIYVPLLCAGSVQWERVLPRNWRMVTAATMLAFGMLLAPLTMPLLGANQFIRYTALLGIPGARPPASHLVQPLFADEFGWQGLARRVATLFETIPEPERRRTAIFADTYADAAALEFYGAAYGLPPPISGQNSYYLWGTRGYDGTSVLAIGASQQALLRLTFRKVVLLGTFEDPYRWAIEGPTPIYLCTRPIESLQRLWPRFQWYGA